MTPRGFVAGDRILGLAADSHPDWSAAFGQLGAYRFLAASAVGKLHLRDARPRDDAFAVRSCGPWLAIAVSDGAGSRSQSRYGSTFAVEALSEHLLREATGVAIPPDTTVQQLSSGENVVPPGAEAVEKDNKEPKTIGNVFARLLNLAPSDSPKPSQTSSPDFAATPVIPPTDSDTAAFGTLTWHQPKTNHSPKPKDTSPIPSEIPPNSPAADLTKCLRHAFQRTRLGLEQFAQSRGVILRELPCTLLGLLLNTETGAVGAGQIGDGLVAAFHPGWGAKPLVEAPTPGETGEVYVLTQGDWEKFLAIRALSTEEAEGIATFYLMTDGVAEDCIHPPPDDIFQRWSRDIDRELRKDEPVPQLATKLLWWLASYEIKGSWDDRTLVTVLRSSDQ